MTNWATRLAGNQLVRNAMALYSVQAARKLMPLILIPYLARTLGPAGWGIVAFTQAMGEFIVLTIEFGFNLSATREIARKRDQPEVCGEIMAGVLGAQALLATAALTCAVVVSQWIPLLRDNPRMLAAGLFYAVAQGFIPLWFFQGLERMRLAATLEITGRILGLAATFVLVHTPDDTWKALFIQGAGPALTTIAGLAMAYREIPRRLPTPAIVREALHRGWPMFVFRSAESLYGVGNAFILGLFATPVYVGYFSSAEKISRAIFGLLNPVREVLYPRVSNLAQHAPEDSARLARIGAMITVSCGLLLSAGSFVFAPWMVHLLMGQAFEPAVTVLRIFSMLPLILSITHSVGLQWLLPMGRDKQVNAVILAAGLLNLLLATILAPHFAHIGMAWAVVSAETAVAAGLVWMVVRSTPPFWTSPRTVLPSGLKTQVF